MLKKRLPIPLQILFFLILVKELFSKKKTTIFNLKALCNKKKNYLPILFVILQNKTEKQPNK